MCEPAPTGLVWRDANAGAATHSRANIVAWAAGGPTDVVARILGEQLSACWKEVAQASNIKAE
jgi:tripartite-type tricarboxylate transporter receptor subunit TctC